MTAHTSLDRRQFGRRESAIYAVAMIPGRAPAHCIVRNFSERGALLEFHDHIVPPFRFRLVIESKGVDVHCEVRHQGQYGVGVTIVSGSTAGLFEAQQGPAAAPNAVPPRSASTVAAPKLTGADLRNAMFGPPRVDPVRTFNPDAGGIIRDT
jgi:hypothetical protein